MLRGLVLLLVCLSLVPSGVVAPAVTTTACTCPVPVPITPPICVRNIDVTSIPSPNSCKDLDGCRTLYSIVQSCLLTIFACVWVAVHRNIPGPQQKSLSIHYEWLKVVVLALLVPEWILAWAVRQSIRAREIAGLLDVARVSAFKAMEKAQVPALGAGHGGRSAGGGGEGVDSDVGNRGGSNDPLINRHHGLTPSDTWITEENLGRTRLDEPWTITHGFFAIMGGFHYYQNGKPLHPLSPKDVIDLVERGALIPPTSKELNDRSKGDALSKGVAIVQTLWFVIQCIARRIEHLPITSLEIMTLAYTIITIAMYTAWWHKPLNVSCAVRVSGTPVEEVDAALKSIWERIGLYVIGCQDEAVTLHQETRVPTFWADCDADSDDIEYLTADVVALAVAMVFGAVHCIAWSYAFPSHIEQLMWRVSAISTIVVPAALLLGYVLLFLIADEALSWVVTAAGWMTCAIAYMAARSILLVLSFTTLRALPFAAYQTVQWTTFMPHI